MDIKSAHCNASFVGSNRVVFNIIKGNSYRLLVAVHYNRGLMYIRFFGNHAEYNAINVDRI